MKAGGGYSACMVDGGNHREAMGALKGAGNGDMVCFKRASGIGEWFDEDVMLESDSPASRDLSLKLMRTRTQ